MADIPGIPDFLMSALGLGGLGARSKPWTSYGGINTSGPLTVIQQLRGHITGATTSLLGPMLGPVAGYFASNWLVGEDFNKTGLLNNNFSGLLAPTAGTYANAFQRLAQRQSLQMLTANRQSIDKTLRRDFYTNYYALTMGKDQRSEDVTRVVDAAMKNIGSVPSILNTILDPAQNRRTLQGIKNTQAGLLYWQSRMDPMAAMGLDTGAGNVRDPVTLAKALGTRVQNMAMDANAWILGKGKANGGYGGFNGASVAELASIFSNAANQIDLSGDAKKLGDSLKAFQDKVRKTSQALAPLKDIFGQDIKAMTDMIQSVSGQNITQLSPAMIRTIAANTADMSRYSGATVAQIAAAGQKLFLQSARMGGNTFSRIGAANTGAYYSGLIAQGNAPAGVHAAEYAGNTQRAVASGQASYGAEMAARAYGIWKDKGGLSGDTSIQTFNELVMKNRTGSGDMLQALLNTAGVANAGGLSRGLATSGYNIYRSSPAGVMLAVSQQYKNKLGTSIAYLKTLTSETGVSGAELDQLGGFMVRQSSSAAVKDLVTNFRDPTARRRFISSARQNGFAVTQQAVNLWINRGQALQQAARWSATAQTNKFQRTQRDIRSQLGALDAMGTGAWLSLWRGLYTANDLSKISGLDVNGKTIKGNAIRSHLRAMLGGGSDAQLNTKWQTVRNALGADAIDVLALASGQRSNDSNFIQSIQKLANAKSDKDRQIAGAQVLARKNKYLDSKISQKTFTTEASKKLYREAIDRYNKDIKKQGTTKQQAGKRLQKGIQLAYRIKQVRELKNTDFGWQIGADRQKRKALAGIIKRGTEKGDSLEQLAKMSETDFNAKYKGSYNGLSLDQIKRAQKITSSGYDRKTDIERLLSTVLQRLMHWLDANKPQPRKPT